MNQFEQAAREQRPRSLPVEFWQFLRHNKKWWLLPILSMIFVFGMLVFLSSTAAAPFIYTLF